MKKSKLLEFVFIVIIFDVEPTIESMRKEWMNVLGYEKLYECSNNGEVRSVDRVIKCKDGKIKKIKGKILRQAKSANGYFTVALSRKGFVKSYSVHRLVCNTFLDNALSKSDVNHKDGNKANNNILNLEWSTRSENIKHAYETGLNNNAKSVLEFSTDGELIGYYKSISEASRNKNVSPASIHKACNGRTTVCNGSQWRYSDNCTGVSRVKKYTCGVSVIMTDSNGNKTVFDSIIEASRFTGAHKEAIFNVCNKKGKTAGGTSWEYLNKKRKL